MTRLFISLGLCLVATGALAADPEVALTIRNHRFMPVEVKVPAGQKVRLMVHNQDPTPEEFESYTLHREKIVAPRATVQIPIGPLKPGRYPFFGEFHEKTARGVVIAE